MKSKKHLNFGSLRQSLSSLFQNLPDSRELTKTDYVGNPADIYKNIDF